MAAVPDPVYIFKKYMSQICCLLIQKDNDTDLLFAGTDQGLLHIWDLKIKREIDVIKVCENACLAIVRSKNNYIIQERGFGLKYWKVENMEWHLLKTIEIEYYGFCKMLVTNNLIYFPCDKGLIKVVEENNESIKKFDCKSDRGEVMCMKFVDDDPGIVVAYESGFVSSWILNDNPKILSELKFDDTPMCLDICELTKEGVLGTSGEFLKKIAIEKNIISETGSATLKNPGVACVTIRKDGKILVAGCWDGKIRYYSMKQLKLLAVLDHHLEGVIQCAIFSEKFLASYPQNILFAAGSDGRISLWDLYTKMNVSSS